MASIPHQHPADRLKHTLLSAPTPSYLRDNRVFPEDVDLPHAMIDAERQFYKVADTVENFITNLKVVTNEREYFEQRFKYHEAVHYFNGLGRRYDFLVKESGAGFPGAPKEHAIPDEKLQDLKNRIDFIGTALRAKVRLRRGLNIPDIQEPDTQPAGEAGYMDCYEEACDCLCCKFGEEPDEAELLVRNVMAAKARIWEAFKKTEE